MKITDYPSVVKLVENNVFLIDGPEGTKQITAKDLAGALCYILGSDGYYEFLDEVLPVDERRNTFRGKNLGPSFTREQAQHIANGDFKGFFIGDYWTDGSIIWRIVDINYWIETGDTACTDPHLVIMPDDILYTHFMNSTDSATGAYVGSEMYKTGLNQAKEIINKFFGAGNILNHRDHLVNAIATSGYSSGSAFYDSTVELPNEIMIYGAYVYTPAGNGSITVNRSTIEKTQLALMQIHPKWVNPVKKSYWLRDVVNASGFANVSPSGRAGTNTSYNLENGVRPVFGITGKELAS